MQMCRIDMSLTDDHVYELLWRNRNPRSNITRMTLKDISASLQCHTNTVWRAIHRLENAGRIERVASNRGRGGLEYRLKKGSE